MKRGASSLSFLEFIAMIIAIIAVYYIFTTVFSDIWSNTFSTLVIIAVFVLWLYFTILFRK